MIFLFRPVIFALVLISSFILANPAQPSVYLKELKAFKAVQENNDIFDEDMNPAVGNIFRNIEINKKLGFFQRLANSVFFNFDPVIATSQTMPALCEYVDAICKKAEISSPAIFITSKKKDFMNAAASKFIGSGGIIIGQELIYSCTQDELEAIIAHEIGHIKYNHVNKQRIIKLFIAGLTALAMKELYNYAEKKINYSDDPFVTMQREIANRQKLEIVSDIVYKYVAPVIAMLGIKLLIGKKYEKDADAFAHGQGKAPGLISFFQKLIDQENKEGKDFDKAYDAIKVAKPQLTKIDNVSLWADYYKAKGAYLARKGLKMLSNFVLSPFDEHPSHSDRITAAQDYLAKQA